jgi:uroporphyrinogen decarboxylase
LVDGRASREYPHTKALMYGEPRLWHKLMTTLTEVVVRYLREQIAAGAEAVQLFDSWLGLLGPTEYEAFVMPYSKRIFDSLRGLAPTIHFSIGTTSLLPLIASAGSDVVSVDWRLPLDDAWRQIGFEKAIQGNLDPALLLAPGDAFRAGTLDVLKRTAGRPGHIFNLGHGILPQTTPEPLERLVELVHEHAPNIAHESLSSAAIG